MKIAFVYNRIRISPGDGIISQALTWKKILEDRGHDVDLVYVWEYFDFRGYDIIQVFSYNFNSIQDISNLYMKNQNLVLAPIIDPKRPLWYDKLFSYYGIKKPVLLSGGYVLRKINPFLKTCLVRSEFEKNRLIKAYGYDNDKCKVVMLSNGVDSTENYSEREDFCLHISRIGDPGKNVKRLIEASEKYKFKLVICGLLRNEEAKRNFDVWMKNKHYVDYKGYVSEEEKMRLCQKAKVFALPSIIEGVGLSALEAATMGCDIVITDIGGPKEYYGNLAKVVNPHSVDEIGEGVRYFLDGNSFQPQLAEYIKEHYSNDEVAKKLEEVYKEVLVSNSL